MSSEKIVGIIFLAAVVGLLAPGCSDDDDTIVVGGTFPDVAVSLAAGSPSGANVAPDATDLAIFLLHVAGDPDQDVDLDDLDLTRTGTVVGSNIASAELVLDDGATSPGVYNNVEDTLVSVGVLAGSQIQFTLSPAVTIPAGTAIDLFVVYDFAAGNTPSGGATLGVQLAADADVGATSTSGGLAANVLGAPVAGSTFLVVG
ncbi:MAG: hypothetical protein ACYS47_20540, partial [Planctomycetota bacterium]